jgi:caffeoyl-CoA O-methyltransferase
MKSFSAESTEELSRYLEKTFRPQDEIQKEIRLRSSKRELPNIHVAEMDGLHLEILTRASAAKKAVEIGTLGGYSGVCIARGLAPQGTLYTFEFEPKHAEVARESFVKAGLIDRVKIHVGPATENLPKIESEGPFDLVFIDADKVNYPAYLQWATKNLRIGGLLIGDNTLAWGQITDEKFDDPENEASVRALQQFNQQIAQNGHFRATLFPTGEGLTVAVKVK